MRKKNKKKSILLDAVKKTRSREPIPLPKIVQDKRKKEKREACRNFKG